MTWFGWVALGCAAVNTLAVIGRIGKPGSTTTPGSAIWVVVLNAAFIVGLLAVGTGKL